MKQFCLMMGVILSLSLILSTCTPFTTPDSATEEILFTFPYRQPCVGVGPMLCMQVRDSADAKSQHFYQSISGFTSESGFNVGLRVRKEKVENPPADASPIRYTLVEEISKSQIEDQLDLTQTDCKLVEIQGKPALSNAIPTLSVTKDCAVAGNAACNQYNAYYNRQQSDLEVGAIATTRKACPQEIML